MRVLFFGILIVGLSVLGFSLALSADAPQTEADKVIAINRAHDAGDAFTVAWNDWASQHDRFKISREDKNRFAKVRKLWKEFDRQCRGIEY